MNRYLITLLASCLSLSAHAWQWQDLWSTPDQQGQALLEKKQFNEAQATFLRNDWAATAAYRAGNYQHAAELYQELKNEPGYYNRGNALARAGQYEEAIKAYDKALTLNPNNEDAIYNRKLVAELLKKDQQNKDQQGKDQQGKDQQGKGQQGKDQQGKDQQGKGQQGKDQQDKAQQGKDQQDKAQQDKAQQDKAQQDKAQQGKAQQGKAQQDKAQQDKDQQDQQQAQQSEADREKQQAKEQWLRLIPDDPGGLMREKFLRDHLRRQRGWYQ